MLDHLKAQFYRTVGLGGGLSVLLIAATFMFPMNILLSREMEGRLAGAVELRAVQVNYNLGRFSSEITGLTSRTVIRQQLLKYSLGEVDFQELASFTEPKYADGARIIEDLIGARRVLPDGRLVCSYGDQELFAALPDLLPVIALVPGSGGAKIAVSQPIVEEGRTLGYDQGIFEAAFMFGNLPPEARSFSLLPAGDEAPAIAEGARRAALPDAPFLLEGKMNEDLLKSEKIMSLAMVTAYTCAAFAIIITLFYFTQYRFVGKIIQRLRLETERKDALLRETHHRIMNNLNAVIAMLQMQMEEMSSAEAQNALNEAIDRVYSMSGLYTRMLRAGSSQKTDMGEFLGDIAERAVFLYAHSTEIKVEKLFQPIILGGDELFPLGVIVNELTTNAAKYAFTGRKTGVVTLHGARNGNTVSLSISDDGPGFPENFQPGDTTGFGISLALMLAEQLGGDIRFENDGGAKATIVFQAPHESP